MSLVCSVLALIAQANLLTCRATKAPENGLGGHDLAADMAFNLTQAVTFCATAGQGAQN